MSSPRKGNKFTGAGSPPKGGMSQLATSPTATSNLASRPRAKTLATKPYIRVAPTDHSAPASIHAARDQSHSDEAVVFVSIGNATGDSGPEGLFSKLGDRLAKTATLPAFRLDYKDASTASSGVVSADIQAGIKYLKDHFSVKKIYLATYTAPNATGEVEDAESAINLGGSDANNVSFVGVSTVHDGEDEEQLFQTLVSKLGRTPFQAGGPGAPPKQTRKASFDIMNGNEDDIKSAAEAGAKLARQISAH